MRRPYLILLGAIIVLMMAGLIVTSLKARSKYRFRKPAEELHQELIKSKHFMAPEKALEIINQKDGKYVFVDIRNPREYDNFHIEGAINIPLPQILDDQYAPLFKDDRVKVLYSNESIKADRAWLLLTQYGYENLLVLQGGANYWKNNVVAKNVFGEKGDYDDEKLKFDDSKIKSAK